MPKKVSTSHAPAALGPYSQAIEGGDGVLLRTGGRRPSDQAAG